MISSHSQARVDLVITLTESHPVTKVFELAKFENNASASYAKQYQTQKTSGWDDWIRDQDLAIDESYGRTPAKS